MSEVIRTVRADEADQFERFLERCYGHRRGFFSRYAPHIAVENGVIPEYCLIAELDGKMVSHVGGYPLEVVAGPARVVVGGIGGVGTVPEQRGQGWMGRLLDSSIERMRERGWTLSVLWGDQQRYASFGWESCGMLYNIHASRRALEWHGVAPADVEEVETTDAAVVERVADLHSTLEYRVLRPHLALQLQRWNLRAFLSDDGYLLTNSDTPGEIAVHEIVSPTGREAELILGVMNTGFSNGANVTLGAGESDRAGRLMPVMNHWSMGPQGMFRILDWPGLLRDLQPLLQERATGLPSFATSIGCRWREAVEWATVSWDGAALTVEADRAAEGVEFDLRALTALVLRGGPHPGRETLGTFGRLLPVPLHIPTLDHV